MKKLIKISLLGLLALVLVACGGPAYRDSVVNFTKVDTFQATQKIENKDNFLLYIGRETCPYCAKLVPDLKTAMGEKNIEVFYLDVEDMTPDKRIFVDAYGVTEVPTLLTFKDGEYRSIFLDHEYSDENKQYPIEEITADIMKDFE